MAGTKILAALSTIVRFSRRDEFWSAVGTAKKKLDFPQKSHRGGVRIAAMHNSQAGYLHSVDRVYRGRKVDRGGRKDARRPSEERAQKGTKREYRRGLESLKVEGIIPLKPRDGIKLAELMFKGQFQRRM